jgi:hypothetical protein
MRGGENDLDGHNDINDTNGVGATANGHNLALSRTQKLFTERVSDMLVCICLSTPFHNNHRFTTHGCAERYRVAAVSYAGCLRLYGVHLRFCSAYRCDWEEEAELYPGRLGKSRDIAVSSC